MDKVEIWCFIKRLLGKYESGIEYVVKLKEINVDDKFTEPSLNEKIQNTKFFRTDGNFVEPIIIDKEFNLISGYGSYLVAKKYNMENVPVYFQDKK